MPELPEAERARQTLERALGRRVQNADDTDTYVCRPHAPGEIAGALSGHVLAEAGRRGKFLWVHTQDGPTLGLHLGMAGRLELDPDDVTRWDRFTMTFEDGGRLVLRDKRRLGRAVLNPDIAHVGPDAAEVDRVDFRCRVGRGRTPIKAKLLDQSAIAGVGNLLADQALWQARISPLRPAGELAPAELDRLRREVRQAVRSAIRKGGAHTGRFIAARVREGVCPRDRHPLRVARIGGRTTYWCPTCQS